MLPAVAALALAAALWPTTGYADVAPASGYSSAEACDSEVQGSAMLQQQMTRTSLLSDTSGASAVVGSSHAWLSSLLSGSEVSAVHAEVTEGGRSARVSFMYGGRQWEYQMLPFSVYAAEAKRLVHTDEGEEADEPLEALPPLTFRAREAENAHGLWASAALGHDSSVTGLFQVEGRVLRLEPFDEHEPRLASLLEVAKTTSNPHHLQLLDLERFHQPRPCTIVDGACVYDSGDGDNPDQIPRIPAGEAEPRNAGWNSWSGTKWWPGCYRGDAELHEMKVAAVVDEDAFREHGESTASKLQSMFADTTFVFEHQFNIKVTIGYQKIYKSTQGAPSYAKGCEPKLKDRFYDFTDKAAQDMPNTVAAAHLFTGCGNGRGTIGWAWIGTLCHTNGYNTGVNEFHRVNDWLTFAHELGHNFGADHSFEEGQGSTGGIMDYGDGKLKGAYQFNTKYRKAQMCREMNGNVGRCRGAFDPAGTSPPQPATPPPTGAPTACEDTSTKCKRGWANKCHKDWVRRACPKTCDACTGSATPAPGSTTPAPGVKCPPLKKRQQCTGGTSRVLASGSSAVECKALCTSAGAGCCTYYSKGSKSCQHATGSYKMVSASGRYLSVVCK